MYEVEITRRKKDENGKYTYFNEPHTYYESAEEAEKNGISYHKDWKQAYVLNELKAGDHVLTKENHVIPVIHVGGGTFPVVRTPNGSFTPNNPHPITSEKFHDRFSLSKTALQSYSSNRSKRKKEYKGDSGNLIKAAWHFTRYGDPVGAYVFGYSETHWFGKMSKSQIRKHAIGMCRQIRFARLYVAELERHFKDAGVKPADLLKNIKNRIISKTTKFDDMMRGSQFLLAIHPDFREQVAPMLVGKNKGQLELPALPEPEDAEFIEIEEEEGDVTPGQHVNKKTNENKKTKTVDAVVSDSIPSEPVLEKQA